MISLFDEQMEYLRSLAHFTPSKVVSGEYEIGLGAIRELLSLIGNPEKQLQIIHVAGTNGKGSTIAFLSQILVSAGYRVGVYTSPALLRATEQIAINHVEISEDDFAHELLSLKPYIEQMKSMGHKPTTEFETVTVMAFQYFLKNSCDIVLLECGLGGQTDATNVIPTPLLSVITSIGLDHTEILGDTLEAIASQKAGIIKENGYAVVLETSENVINVFANKCTEVRANLITSPLYDDSLSDISLGLEGEYQIQNASLAKTCALVLRNNGYHIPDQAIIDGLRGANWPCRFEIVNDNPNIVIDGGHNIEGVNALVNSLIRKWPDKKFRFVVGILRDKSYSQIINLVLPLSKKFYTVTVPSPRALPAKELSSALMEIGAESEAFDSIENALASAISDSSSDDIICAFGSLYYVGILRDIILSK